MVIVIVTTCYITVVASRYCSGERNMGWMKLSGVILLLFSVGIYFLK